MTAQTKVPELLHASSSQTPVFLCQPSVPTAAFPAVGSLSPPSFLLVPSVLCNDPAAEGTVKYY